MEIQPGRLDCSEPAPGRPNTGDPARVVDALRWTGRAPAPGSCGWSSGFRSCPNDASLPDGPWCQNPLSVSELGQVLELLHSSPSLWHSLHATGIEWTDPPLFHEAFQRDFDVHGLPFGPSGLKTRSWSSGLVTGGVSFTATSPDDASADDDDTEIWRLWIEQPDRRRAEFEVGQEIVTAVWMGDTWWSWSPSQGAMTNNGDPNRRHGKGPSEPLVETQALLGAVTFEFLGRADLLGREVLNARAIPHPQSMASMGALHGLGSRADDYHLSVDTERGVVLRSEARLGSKPFKIIEMTEVTFDLKLPPETFQRPTQ